MNYVLELVNKILFLLDTEYVTRAEVASALIHKPVIKLQLRTSATKEVPLSQLKPPTNGPQLEEETMYAHKIKRKLTSENLNEEVMKATRDLFNVANQLVYHKGKLRLFGYVNKVFIARYETAPDIALDYNVQSNTIKSLPTEVHSKVFYHLRHPIAELIRHDWVYLIMQRRLDMCDD